MSTTTTTRKRRRLEPVLVKVPEITFLFWVLKLLTTGMGEAMSDFLGQQSVPLAAFIGLAGIAVAVRLQLNRPAYSAPYYWFAVMMVAVFGTMAADGIHDGVGIGYDLTTPLFALVTAGIFLVWYRTEGPSRSTASPAAVGSGSTGRPFSPRSRWAPRPATSLPTSSTSASGHRSCCSRSSSRSRPSPGLAAGCTRSPASGSPTSSPARSGLRLQTASASRRTAG